jgi:hypothetical protein
MAFRIYTYECIVELLVRKRVFYGLDKVHFFQSSPLKSGLMHIYYIGS